MNVDNVNEQPGNLIEQIADAGINAVEQACRDAGVKLGVVYIAVHAYSEALERDPVTAAAGDDLEADLSDILAFLMNETIAIGKQLGLDVKLVPLRGGPFS